MPGKSLSAFTPNEPAQKHSPFEVAGTAAKSAATSASVLTTRGKDVRVPAGTALAITLQAPLTVRVRRPEVDRFVAGLAKAADRPATDAGFSVSVESVGITEARPGRREVQQRG